MNRTITAQVASLTLSVLVTVCTLAALNHLALNAPVAQPQMVAAVAPQA
jgi:hypothetical protein